MPLLQFAPLSSSPSPSFFHALTAHKLDVAKLDDDFIPIVGEFAEGKFIKDRGADGREVGLSGSVNVDGRCFDGESFRPSQPTSTPIRGLLKNFNTIEEFRSADKPALFQHLLDTIHSTLTTPTPHLNSFLLLTFADLKKYKYYYWFAFPGFVQKPSWEVEDEGTIDAGQQEEGWKRVESKETETYRSLILPFKSQYSDAPAGVYLSKLFPSTSSNSPPPILAPPSQASTFFNDLDSTSSSSPLLPTLLIHDPSTLPSNPGWPLRNALYYLSHLSPSSSPSSVPRRFRVVLLRDGPLASRSAVVSLPESSSTEEAGREDGGKLKAVGWEKNEKGKLGPRMVDLGASMDPTRLADQAVDLNLKLMRWRILPSLDLPKISSTRCLLLGAGTLGCYVSRVLLGWGVRNITFVDSSTVSFSNPVRQPLFEFADSLDGGKEKAHCAADALRRIFPGVNAQSHTLSIPMPGHPIPPPLLVQTQDAVSKLELLIDQHDVVFLLMDSRESRWLPTLLGASKGRVVINAALGFDSYLVMRHGEGPFVGHDEEEEEAKRGRLACYFCQDSNALGNSLNDRTLDQMCTVSRPGLAAIASATAVEMLISLLTHPLGAAAPAESPAPSNDDSGPETDGTTSSPLGIVPHQLRGGLSSFQTLNLRGDAFSMCTACGPKVVAEYRSAGFDMLRRAFDEPEYLARLSGLEALNRETEEAMEAMLEGSDGDGEDF